MHTGAPLNGCQVTSGSYQQSFGGNFGQCTAPVQVVSATQQIVSDPAAKVAVIGAPTNCAGSYPKSYLNMIRTAAALDALQSVGMSPTMYMPPGVSTACGVPEDNVAVLERGFAYRVNPTTLADPFDSMSPSGVASVATNTTGYEVTGGATRYGQVPLANTSTAQIVAGPSPSFAAFTNQSVTGSLQSVTPAQISSVAGGETVGVPAMSACGPEARMASGASFF